MGKNLWKKVKISAKIAGMYGQRARKAAVKAGKIGETLPTTEELIWGAKPRKRRKK